MKTIWKYEDITDSYFHDRLYKLNGEVKIFRQYNPITPKKYIAYFKDDTEKRYISLAGAKQAIEKEYQNDTNS